MSLINELIDTPMGKMPSEWKEFQLSELSEFITKGATPTTYGFSWQESGIPFLRSECVSETGYTESGISYISEKANDAMGRSKIKGGDILISITGNVGRIAVYPLNCEEGNINQHIARVRIVKTESAIRNFIYYQLNQPNYRSYYNGIVTGAAYPQLSLKQIRETKVFLPPLPTQKRIADILSGYDDLIENNLKRIKLLEQAAQNIYKEWFVNLRFPGHENVKINEKTGLPEGWVNGGVSDFGKVITGKTPSTKRTDFYEGSIPFIKTPDMHGLPYVIETSSNLTELGAQSQLNKNLPANSVVVSCIGTAGVVAMTSKISQTNQQINAVVFDSSFKSYYFYGFAKGLKLLLEGLGSNGATMVNVNKGKFENINLIIPSQSLLEEYSKIAKPMFNQMLTLSIQNQKLKAARDILLPRLMNRTIKV